MERRFQRRVSDRNRFQSVVRKTGRRPRVADAEQREGCSGENLGGALEPSRTSIQRSGLRGNQFQDLWYGYLWSSKRSHAGNADQVRSPATSSSVFAHCALWNGGRLGRYPEQPTG